MRDIFAGKAALVTGAAGGIGTAIALRLAAEGACIAVADIDLERSRATVEKVRSAGGTAEPIQVDLADVKQIGSMIASTVKAFGRLDYVVNNANESRPEFFNADLDFMSVTPETWDAFHAINSRAAAMTIQKAIPELRKNGGGAIVNIVTAGALTGMAMLTAYTSSKGALISLNRHIAATFGKENIRCNAIAPGLVVHDRLIKKMPSAAHATTDNVLLNYHVAPEDVADGVAFLLSDAARCITGIILPIDSGASSGRNFRNPKSMEK